jgi:FixJ family two-component response regulator
LIVDAHSIPTHCAQGYPIVVTAARADVAMAVKAMKSGAVDFVEKPLREQEIVTAVLGAIERDRQQRVVAARHAEWRTRFATLSPRERQVMKLVTAGKLNKQVGGELGLSEITVKAHRGAAMRKMKARSLADLVRMADAIGDALAPVLEMRA